MTAAHLSIADVSISSIAERWQPAPLPDTSDKARAERREAKEARRAFALAFAFDGVVGWWDHPASRRREWLLSLSRIQAARARREPDRNWLLATLRNYERCREAEGRPIAYLSGAGERREAKEARRAFALAFAFDGVVGWWDHPASRRREWLLSLQRIRAARARRESDRYWLLATLRNYERCREAEGRPIAYVASATQPYNKKQHGVAEARIGQVYSPK